MFAVAPFAKDHTTGMQEQKSGIDATFLKLGLDKEGHEWDSLFDHLPANENEVPIEPFFLPKPRSSVAPVAMYKMALPIDKVVRKVDIVTHAKLKNSEHVKQLKRASAPSCPLFKSKGTLCCWAYNYKITHPDTIYLGSLVKLLTMFHTCQKIQLQAFWCK